MSGRSSGRIMSKPLLLVESDLLALVPQPDHRALDQLQIALLLAFDLTAAASTASRVAQPQRYSCQ
jgi:hypothetical protein